MDLGFEIQKTNFGIRIHILEIPCVPSFRQMDKFDFFGLNLAKNQFLVWNSGNKCWNKNRHPRDTMCVNFQTKRTTLTFFGPNMPKNKFLGWKFRKLMLEKERHPWDTTCSNVETKRTTLTFGAQICPEIDFGVGISEN